jgi:N-acyl-D-aspartate/D-glutamate deacylase
VISLPHAIRSSSGLPAEIIGLANRGYLKEGYKADIVVFDLENFRDRSTPMHPELMAEGVLYLLVNGVLAIEKGNLTGALAGEVIERNESSSTRSGTTR